MRELIRLPSKMAVVISDYRTASSLLDITNRNVAIFGQRQESAKQGLPIHTDNIPSTIPVHPDVCFKQTKPHYEVVGEVMKPTLLVPYHDTFGRFHGTFFGFTFTSKQVQEIVRSREYRQGAKREYAVQVHIRFCWLDTTCEQDDIFPPRLCVQVNGEMIHVINPTLKSKKGTPVDITALCRLSPSTSNVVDVSWASEAGRDYCMAIYLVRRLTSDVLLQRLKQFGNRHPDQTVTLIKKKMSHELDSDIATTSLRVSLICPIGKTKIQIPCRSSTCRHLQCFDAKTFIMMNEKKATWMCPLCDQPAPFDKLFIDGYFLKIFQSLSATTEVQFAEDGSWTPVEQNTDSTLVISSPSVPDPAISPHEGSSQKTIEVIDLTGDSSDEESSRPPLLSTGRASRQGNHSNSPNQQLFGTCQTSVTPSNKDSVLSGEPKRRTRDDTTESSHPPKKHKSSFQEYRSRRDPSPGEDPKHLFRRHVHHRREKTWKKERTRHGRRDY